jgi:cell division protein FtsB
MSETTAQGAETAAPKPPPGRRGRRLVRYALVFFTVVVVIDAVVGEKGLLALMRARAEYARLEDDLGQLRTANARLREEARRLREEPEAVEEIARRELGLIKPGETVFIIRDRAQAPKSK